MRSSRLLSILLKLQNRGRMTAQAMAEEFEVSVRTVYRDIDQLSAAGVPVYADRGPGGGFQLLDGYRTRLTGLTPQEAMTLALAGLPGPAAELGLGEALADAQLKLLAALPDAGRAAAQSVGARFHLDPVGWFRDAEDAARLPELARAIWNERRITVRYSRWEGEVERTLDPLGLVLKAGVWYLAAAVGAGVRIYRVSSILEHAILDEGFIRPEPFDLPRFWQDWSARYEAGVYQSTARVRGSPKGLRRLVGLSPAVARAVLAAPPGDELTELAIPIETIDQAARALLGHCPDVEVLGPPELRARMTELAADLARTYLPA